MADTPIRPGGLLTCALGRARRQGHESATMFTAAASARVHAVSPDVPRLWAVPGNLSLARVLKRALDIVGSSLGLILLAPLFVFVSLLILITSGRPVFYLQERVGQGGRLFRMLKFRSMRRDAEHATGPIWATTEDARCTKTGAWLRRYNLDELPQLVNVLAGEMSLVGPRPERPVFVAQFLKEYPGYDTRHRVPVGMTGWAQVHGWRGRTSLQRRLDFDLDYVRRWTVGLDLLVLVMTIQHVLWGKTDWDRPARSIERRLDLVVPPRPESV